MTSNAVVTRMQKMAVEILFWRGHALLDKGRKTGHLHFYMQKKERHDLLCRMGMEYISKNESALKRFEEMFERIDRAEGLQNRADMEIKAIKLFWHFALIAEKPALAEERDKQ